MYCSYVNFVSFQVSVRAENTFNFFLFRKKSLKITQTGATKAFLTTK